MAGSLRLLVLIVYRGREVGLLGASKATVSAQHIVKTLRKGVMNAMRYTEYLIG